MLRPDEFQRPHRSSDSSQEPIAGSRNGNRWSPTSRRSTQPHHAFSCAYSARPHSVDHSSRRSSPIRQLSRTFHESGTLSGSLQIHDSRRRRNARHLNEPAKSSYSSRRAFTLLKSAEFSHHYLSPIASHRLKTPKLKRFAAILSSSLCHLSIPTA